MEENNQVTPNAEETKNQVTHSSDLQKALYGVVAILAVASLVYRGISYYGLETTSFLFVGIPAIIAIAVIRVFERPKTAYGAIFQVITIFFLLSAVLMGEGVVCIIMAAPIFYGVGAIIGLIVELLRKRDQANLQAVFILPFLFIAGEGHKIFKQPPLRTITTTQIVSAQHSLDNLNTPPNFMEDLPLFFQMGFPKPIAIEGEGLEQGSLRKIQFESNTKGIGTLSLQIKKRSENHVVFKMVEDDSHINHWMRWHEITVSLHPNNDGTKTLNWTTQYYCTLGPSWYFEPIEYAAINISNQHLINCYFGDE